MNIVKVSIPRQELDRVPAVERDFIVALAFWANQLNVLTRLIAVANRPYRGAEIERLGRNMQIGFLLRLLAGQLKEGWVFLGSHYWGSRVSLDYDVLLADSGTEALARLKTYFAGDNLVNTIRSQYAHHIPADHLARAIQNANEPFDMYFGPFRGACLYWGAESLAMWKLVLEAGGGDAQVGFVRVFEDVLDIGKCFQNFADACIAVFSERVGLDGDHVTRTETTIEDLPDIDSLDLPFLVQWKRGGRGT